MEGSFRERFEKLECAVKREKRSRDYSSSDDNQQDSKQGIIPPLNKDNKLEKAKAEMGEVKEENQRLKMYLSQIMEDYKSLQKKFHDAVDHQQEIEAKESVSTVTTTHQENRDLVSLCLGRSTAASSSDHVDRNPKKDHQDDDKEGLALGLDCNFKVSSTMQQAESDNSVEEVNIREKTDCPPSKDLKKGKSNGDEQEAQQQNNPAKKARVSVRVRCDTPTMNDGCQWRKYGQKIAKGNPCPRAYYRCTVSTTCPVRKQVQRCAQDMSILITTYEGTHNHPLPMSATAMASTTSAAASMLMSGSSTSGSNPNNPSSTTTPAELHGLNFYFSDGSKPNPYYPQNHSLSPSPSCPTITLDLTSNTISSSSSSSSPLFNKSTLSSNNFMPRYSTTNLNFSSWNNMNGSGGLTYGVNSQQPYIKNQIGSVNFGRQPHQESLIYQSYMQKNMPAASSTQQQQSLQANYTIEAATKAITSDPNFQSALQAALSSIINSSGVVGCGGGSGSGGGGDTKFGNNSTSKSKSTSPEDIS